MRLNKLGYEQLINEDIAWLETIPRTLERDHIILVLRASINHEYPDSIIDLSPESCEEHCKFWCDCDK